MSVARRAFIFLGVSTGQSSINRIFPGWMTELGRPEVALKGVDLRLHDERTAYRAVIEGIRSDPASLGGVVTSHKVDVLDAARDLFDYLDPIALALGEVSCIAKGRRGLEGRALDAVTAGESLDAILGAGYFGRTSGQLLCFGAGGAAASIATHFARQTGADRPARFVLVNRSQPRLDRVRDAVANLAPSEPLNLDPICNEDPRRNDDVLASMPEGSLVINATGMGKDRPGSPITNEGVFPLRSIAWDLNYRGELLFLQQARKQALEREVRVEDGWDYFVRGWAAHVAEVLHVDLSPERLARLSALAASRADRDGLQ